jgi:hypothetical protein
VTNTEQTNIADAVRRNSIVSSSLRCMHSRFDS